MANVIFSSSLRNWLEKTAATTGSKVANYLLGNSTDAQVNYLTARGQMLSFLPAGKEHAVNENGTWKRDGRQEGKPAKVARKALTPEALAELKDKDFEEFANLFKATADDEGSDAFELVDGDAIREAYHEANYEPGQGSLATSCMRHDCCQDYLGIYTDNPDVCSLLVLRNADGKVKGRALVWKTIELQWCFMDRIYGSDATMEAFKAYARRQGWAYKRLQGYGYHGIFTPDGEEHLRGDGAAPLTLTVSLSNYEHSQYPYVDTFSHTDDDGDLRTNSGRYTMDCTDGSRTDNESNLTYSELECETLDPESDSVVFVNSRDDYAYDHNCFFDTYRQEWVWHDDCETCEYDGETYHKDDGEYLRCVGWVHKDNLDEYVELQNGDHAHKDDAVRVENDSYVLKEDAVTVRGRNYSREYALTMCHVFARRRHDARRARRAVRRAIIIHPSKYPTHE